MERIVLILVLNISSIGALFSSSIIVGADIGFDALNSTSFLQYAFQETTEDTIIIDYIAGAVWNTGPLTIERSNVTIIFEKNVVLQALPGAFGIFESLIQISDQSNIDMIGYGATLMMNREEYVLLNDSEFRHGLSLGSVTNMRIEGLTIIETGGDGILLTRSFRPNSPKNYCENITILNCKLSNNYRQGLSVTSVSGARILNSEFSETSGTLPEDGIDFEPDIPEERIENVLVKDCRIFNNNGNAIQFAMFMMNDNSRDISITIENTYMANNHDPSNTFDFAEIAATDNGNNGVDGFVTFKNCFIESSEWTAVYVSKTVLSYFMNFENCVFKDVSNNLQSLNNPIFLEVTDYSNPVPRFGGLNFKDCVIEYDQEIPFFNLVENIPTSPGLGDVTGNFFIVSPSDNGLNLGSDPMDVNIEYQHFTEFPEASVNLKEMQVDYLEQEQNIIFEVERELNSDMPLAVLYNYSGKAIYGLDYERAPGVLVIPPNTASTMDTIEIVLDTIIENSELLTLVIEDDSCYTIGNDSMIHFSINDGVVSLLPEYELGEQIINVFYRPDNAAVAINVLDTNFNVRILQEDQSVFKAYDELSFPLSLDINDLPEGLFFIEIANNANELLSVQRILKN